MQNALVRTDRLAELIADLSGCSATAARAAVQAAAGDQAALDDDERLAVVARALVAIRRARRPLAQSA